MIKLLEQYGSTPVSSANTQAKALAEKKRLQAIADAKAVASAKARVLSQQKAYADAQAKAKADAQAVNDAKAKVLSQQNAYADAQAKAQLLAKNKADEDAKALSASSAKAVVNEPAKAVVNEPARQPVAQPTQQPVSSQVVPPSAPISTADATTTALNASKDAQLRGQDLAWQEAQRLANEQIQGATAQAETLAQEAFVAKKQQERVLPNVMAQAGLAGQGYTETTANNIGTSYQNAWNSVMKNKGTALDSINSALAGQSSKINQNKAGIDAQYQSDLANYATSLQKQSLSGKSGSSGSSGNGKAPKAPKAPNNPFGQKDPEKDPYGVVKDALAGFQWVLTPNGNPDPQPTRVAMKAYLQNLVTNKYMTATELDEYINKFMEGYFGRPTVAHDPVAMGKDQRRILD